uniref:Ionotropic glutamate receptor L-glutamate and glycine-binding domain-containing protein n=1 Tax=Anopheles coluzzii TaxID=1518534 RepID=A0A6E8WBE2_ANOCL
MTRKLLCVVVLVCFVTSSANASLVVKPAPDDYKAVSTASLVERILLESTSIPIETYTLAGTNESFVKAVIDRLAWRAGKLMIPMFNNALPSHVQTRQLIIMGADDVETMMVWLEILYFIVMIIRILPNYFAANNRDIYIILLLSDLRFLNGRIVFLLSELFSSINFIVIVPPPFEFQPPLLISTDYNKGLVIVPHDVTMREMFSDRFDADRHPVVKIVGYGFRICIRINEQGQAVGYDWNVFRTILVHMKLRWHVTVYELNSTMELMQWFNKELDEGHIEILIDRTFRPDTKSVQHVLPEMNGVCLIIPKTQKYEILQHLLRPFASTAWIVLIVALLVGSCIAKRHFRHSLLDTLIFGVDLDAGSVSRKERFVLFACLVVFFILSEAYQAKLLALISSSRYPPDPKTVAEFLQTDTLLYVGEATATVLSFRPSLTGRVRKAADYWFTFDGEQDYGTLMQCPVAWDFFLRWTNRHYNLHGYNVRPRVHIVAENILSLSASYTFSRSFLLYPRFKVYLDRIYESGLMRYWQTEQDRRQMFEQKFVFVENEIISFNDLIMVWIVLGIGHGLAFGVFLIELLSFLLKRYVRNRWPATRRQQRLFKKSKKHRQLFPSIPTNGKRKPLTRIQLQLSKSQ